MSQARTAGRAFRVWRLQRQMDADVDTLPESQQSRLGDTLVRSGPDAREAFRRMSQDALSELTALDVDPAVRAQLAPKYAEFGSTKRQQLSSLVDGDSVAASNAGRLETEGVRNALDYACNSPCSIQTDLGSPTWKVDAEVHDSLKTRLSSDQFQRLAESGVGTGALEATD